MSRVKQFKLPDLGEGLTEGEILQWMVAVGEQITLNQPIVEVETAKAAVEVPSPFAGVVTEIHHAAGQHRRRRLGHHQRRHRPVRRRARGGRPATTPRSATWCRRPRQTTRVRWVR